MSFADHIVLWLHIAAAVFTIGPGTAAIMSTPRYIRKHNTTVVGYLYRTTRIYSVGALLVLIFGLISAGQLHDFSKWWISVSLTLFVVAFILLVLIMRDQGKALAAMARAEVAAGGSGFGSGSGSGEGAVLSVGSEQGGAEAEAAGSGQPAPTQAADLRLAAVERGRIVSMGGLTALIWLVILVLMVWK
jgi:hypothetical protein